MDVMKKTNLIILFTFFTVIGFTQSMRPGYDKQLADSLGADQYGMKMYAFVILKTGTVVLEDKTLRDSIFHAHLNNIVSLVEAGKLIVSGPLFENEKQYEGIFIFNASMKETTELLKTDPAIQAGLLNTEIYNWYGSAALPMYLKYHDKVQMTDF